MSRARGRYALALLGLAILYAPTAFFSFAGGDDFREVARARFEDSRRPREIFLSSHDRNRFRPLDRLATLVTYELGGGEAAEFRIRNIVCHLGAALLVGLMAGSLLGDHTTAGPLAAFLFGAHPSNALVVGLAVTTKTLFGLCFVAACFVWQQIVRRRRLSPAAAVLVFLLTVATVGLHEQGVGLILVSLLIPAWIWREDGRKDARWLVSGIGLALAEIAVLALGRGAAGVFTAATTPNAAASIARNAAYAAASLAAPIDFLALVGPFALSRRGGFHGVTGAERIGAAVWLAATVLMVVLLVGAVRSERRANPVRLGRLLAVATVGLLLLLLPAVLFTKYSELYNYLPSALVVTLVVALFAPAAGGGGGSWARRHGTAVLLVLAASYAFGSAHRNWLLGGVARQTESVLRGVGAAVPRPAPGSTFLLSNDPELRPGYSLYGLRGVSTLEDFGASPAIRLLYGRIDLSARLVAPGRGEDERVEEGERSALYRLAWSDDRVELRPAPAGSAARATAPAAMP